MIDDLAHLRPVDDLIRQDEIARLDLLAQAADGGEGNNGLNAHVLERRDVGLVATDVSSTSVRVYARHFRRQQRVAEAMPRKEGKLLARGQRGDDD